MNVQPISVGQYLARRLRQLGTTHLFGVPGDFSLNLLDDLLRTGDLTWVGSANELNAAYAADGYARVGRRPGALVTTFGVGELSAVNGLAGSYAEDVPVVHLVGLPSRKALADGPPLHHTFLDGDLGRFSRIAREVTAATVVLEEYDRAAQIDAALGVMMGESKPVYIGVPLDLVGVAVDGDRLTRGLDLPRTNASALRAFQDAARSRLAAVGSLSLLVGHRVHRRALEDTVREFASHDGVRVATQTGSKALLDEGHPASVGTYLGAVTRDPRTRAAIDDADLLVLAGTVFSDFTTGFFTQRFDPDDAIELAITHARVGHAIFQGVRLEDSLAALSALVEERGFDAVEPHNVVREPNEGGALPDEPLTHATMWPLVQRWLQPDMTVVAEAGTAFYGAIDLDLSDHNDLLGQPIWSSIGYTLPAAVGAALASPERRPLLFIGDGSAQLTIQELGHLFSTGTRPIVVLLDNDGYTVERLIQSPDAAYQNIQGWDWPRIPSAFGAPGVGVHSARTTTEFAAALLAAAQEPSGSFIHTVLPRMDAPRLLIALTQGISETNRDRH